MVIYGHRLFGKVDSVPGLGFVATKFFHIDYVPLVPTECWLVFQQSGKGWRGIRIPMSGKSVLTAWLRTGSVIGIGMGTIGLIVAASSNHADPGEIAALLVFAVVAAGLFAFTKLHKSVAHASYARACELAKLAKLNPNGMAALAAAYGQQPKGVRPVRAAIQPVEAPAVDDSALDNSAMNDSAVDDSFPVELIPLEEVDGIPIVDDQSAIGASAPAPQQPRSETRRHG